MEYFRKTCEYDARMGYYRLQSSGAPHGVGRARPLQNDSWGLVWEMKTLDGIEHTAGAGEPFDQKLYSYW